MTRRLLTLLAVLGLLCAVAGADVVHLKDGRRIGGTVLSEGSRIVRVRMNDGKTRTFKTEDVERIDKGADLEEDVDLAERDAPFMPGLSEQERKNVREEAERFAGPMNAKLDAAARPNAWVFGDHPQQELSQVAQAVQETVEDFVDVFGCDVEEILPGRYAGKPGQFYVFQFEQEPAYLRFIDRVFDRMRDETVNDERLALMRRQKGFWVMTPRPLMARYRGPSTQATICANASHQASHSMLLLYRPAGDWMPWWLLEGVATWQEIRLRGHNLTYCIEVARPGDYASEGTPDADEMAKAKTAERWRREVKQRVRARDEHDFTALAKLSLNEIVLEDVQQSWSVVDWLDRQGKLVKFVLAYKEHRTLDAAFRHALDTDPLLAYQTWREWVLSHY
ncbi:MAG: hypothetical protein HKP30_05790 [Myxococcales bacterium]|nr:hypothetical protein [Myxococcales bacterium]